MEKEKDNKIKKKEDLSEDKEQIEKYDSLKWDETYRGQTMILLWMLSAAVIGQSFVGNGVLVLDLGFNIIMVLLTLIPLSLLIYKGKIWAIITTQILLPLVILREVSIYSVNTDFKSPAVLFVGFLVYCIVMKSLVKSYRIEKARKHI